TTMQGIRPCLTFDGRGEEAVNLYVSAFTNSRITSLVRYEEDAGPMKKGQLMQAIFEIGGREFAAMDGGPSFAFSDGISLVATCDDQEELDQVWAQLTADGGEEGRCGWCKDRFGVSWQVVPAALGEMMGDPKSGDPGKVMEALLQMNKLDIATLRAAYQGVAAR
ncbi:MAG: VOC family protein, partial [Chloroflexota bacterium]